MYQILPILAVLKPHQFKPMAIPLVPVKYPFGKYYAIELKETKFKHFQDSNSDDTTQIIFRWDEVINDISQTRNDITIQVAKKNPDYSSKAIKDIAQAVFDTKNIRELDRIFGIQDKNIDKIGYVRDKKITDTTIRLDISWVSESALREIPIPVFREDEQIQQLKLKDLLTIKEYYGDRLDEVYDRMPSVENIAHEFEIIERNNELQEFLPKQEPGGKIKLFYGTNRKPTGKEGKKQIYGSEQGKLECGICQVSIPRGHIQGEMERPQDFWIIKFMENADMHIMVQSIQPMDNSSFINHFSETIKNTPKKNALLFVHGYNNSFEDAARRTAQIAWDLQFDGFSGFFSWPSAARKREYFSDEASARSSMPALVEFLEKLILEPELEQLHIIAHSMGSLVTTLSLNELRAGGTVGAAIQKIQQLILGAPDIDQTEFRNNILPKFKNIGLRRTVYTSDHDIAMKASSEFRIGRLRLGQIADSIFLDQDIDTIEASNVVSNSSHGYLFESETLLSDLFYLINENLNPSKRRLREIKMDPLRYWLFSK